MCSRRRGSSRRRKQDDGWAESGGYMAAKVKKLEEQVLNEQSIKSEIFKGVAIFVNGYTKPSAFDLKQMIISNGGIFHHYYSLDKVTHIIASNLPNSKVANLSDSKKVCRPDWIVDSISAGQLLPYQDYLLYSARTKIQPGVGFKVLSDDRGNVASNSTEGKELPQNDLTVTSDVIKSNTDCTSDKSPTIKSPSVEPTKSTTFRSPSKAGDPKFVAEFYNNSRLHHLSTWSAEFKAYVSRLQQQNNDSFPGRIKLREFADVQKVSTKIASPSGKQALKKVIMHIDMDCFFVSVGLQNHPDLIGKPIAVTHSKGKGTSERPTTSIQYEKAFYEKKRKIPVASSDDLLLTDDLSNIEGEMESIVNRTKSAQSSFHSMAEIASCSYEARAMGVKNGMFMGKARQICPDLVTIPYDFEGYNRVSRLLYDTVATYTHEIEAVSCDEMFVDCTDILSDTGVSPDDFAQILRAEIKEKTQCNASAGLGPNILIARLATKVAKPNGQHFVEQEQVEDFIKDKSIKDLPGVGWSTSNKLLQKLNVVTCADLKALSLEMIQKELGPKTGQSLYNSCRGIDTRPIASGKERKSVSAEINYGIRFTSIKEADKFIESLADEVHNRLQKIGAKGKTITLKVKVRKEGAPKETAKFLGHGVCDNMAKSVTLPMASDSEKAIAKETLNLLHSLKVRPDDLRGLGIQISRLEMGIGQKGNKSMPSILNFTTSIASSKRHDVGGSNSTVSVCDNNESIISKQLCDDQVSEQIEECTGKTLTENAFVDCKIQSTPKSASDAQNKTQEQYGPPLPMLPDLNASPESSFSELLNSNNASSVPSRDSWKTTVRSSDVIAAGDIMLPSPSQIDPQVLKELPAELRIQIQSALKKKSETRPSNADKDSDFHNSQEAGCSHWQNQRKEVNALQSKSMNNLKNSLVTDTILALPSYSQIDPACLAALPEDMQAELKKAYSIKQQEEIQSGNDTGSCAVHPLMMPHRSPNKLSPGKSPSKVKRQSPIFKVPRGRPRGGKNKKFSPKKLDYGRQPKINMIGQPVREPDEVQGTEPLVTEQKNFQYVPHHTPSLCGAVTLTEVKNLLREWIDSSEGPEDEDLAQFVSYLSDLVQDKNLEMLHLIVLFMNRLLRKKDCNNWHVGGMFVVQQVQDIMKCIHGAELALT